MMREKEGCGRLYGQRGATVGRGATYIELCYAPTSLPIDPKITGGTLTFTGTRVAIKTLFDYLAAGEPLDEFLADFPSVSREHATGVLQAALAALLLAHLQVVPAQIDFSFIQTVPHEAAA